MEDRLTGFRLSPRQKRLWRLQDGGEVYRARGAVDVEGALQPAALGRALGQVVARHAAPRATFRRLSGFGICPETCLGRLT